MPTLKNVVYFEIWIWIIPMHNTITFYPGLQNNGRLSQGVYFKIVEINGGKWKMGSEPFKDGGLLL
jgi:hypothetical protein